MRPLPLFLVLALSQATLTAAAPSITTATPGQVDAGGPAFTLNINGSDFVQGSIVKWGATPLATTFNGTGMLFATVPASLIALSGRFVLTVTNPDGSVSDPYTNLYVDPTLTAISPNTAQQGSAGLTITATGAGFVSTSLVVAYNSAGANFLTTTYIGPTSLRAVIPAGLMASAGVLRLGIFDDTAGVSSSNAFNFNVGAGIPNLSSLSPISTIAGYPPFTLTVNGTGFVAGAAVHWADSVYSSTLNIALATTFISSTQLTAAVPASAIARAGTMLITVTNPAGAASSNYLTFLVAAGGPSLSSLSPASTIGPAPFTLTVNGSGFVAGASVCWNGSPLITNFVSSTQLTAVIPSSALTTAGNVSITVTVPLGAGPSNPLPFLVVLNPQVTLAGAAPSQVDAGGPNIRVAVSGSNFVPGAVVNWGSLPLATEFVSSTQLAASVPAYLTTLSTRVSLSVRNPDTSVSGNIPFTVLPVLAAITPPSAAATSASLNITVTGAGFTRSCGIAVEKGSLRSALPVTYVSSTTLLAALDGFVLASPGSWSVTVVDAAAGSSRPALFAVSVSTPVITSLSPASMPGRGTDFPLTVNGTGFVSGSQVAWNGAKLSSLYSAPGQLTAVIPGALTAAPGVASVTVVNPDGAQSPPVSFQVGPITPVITGVTPTFGYAGGPAFPITASGINFVAGSTLMWGSTPLTTTFMSSTQLTAIVPPELTALSAAVRVTVMNPGSAQSYLEYAAIYRVEPVLSAISPSSVNAGDAGVSITATGIGFVAGDGLTLNGTAFPSTLQSSTTLTGTIPASLVATPGTASIQVINLDNQTVSRSLTLTILAGAIPQVTSLSPSSWIAGGAAFTLTVNGSGFSSGATVRWNAAALSTTYVSGSQLQALVPANLLAAAGSANITVANPQGAASAGAAFPVVASSSPAVITASPNQVDAGAPAFPLTVTGANFVNGSTVYWASTTLATTFSSSTQLSAQVPAGLLTTSGKFNITVRNPDGAVSNGSTAVFVQPVLVSMNTNTLAAGAGTTLFVTGIGFAPSNYLRLINPAGTSFELATTLVSPTALAATVPASAVAFGGAYMAGVMDPSGAFSRGYSLTVVAALQLTSLSPASAIAGGGAFTLTLNGAGFTGGTTVHWNTTALSVTYTSGSQLQALVPAALIAAAGSVTISAEDLLLAERATASFAVHANTPLPTTSAAGIVNAASSLPSIAPGSLFSIYGTSLAASRVQASDVPLPLTLGGTSVSVNGTLVPLLFVSPGQINAQLPYDKSPGTATVVVHSDSLDSAPVDVAVSATGPGVMTLLLTNHALVVNVSDGSLNSAERPVKSGEYVTAYVTGQGLVDHPVATGAAAPSSPFSLPLAPVQVRIGGQAADIQFAGLAPGFVGLLQLNVLVPNVVAGEQKFEVVIGGVPANPTVISVGGR